MSRLSENVRLAVRRLRRTPGFTTVVLLTLALGIGANTAVFSAVHAVLLRPLPYRDAERLVVVDHHYPSLKGLLAGVSAPGFADYRDRVRAFEASAAQTWWTPNLTGRGEPERLVGMRVSGGYFAMLGVGAARGRTLSVRVTWHHADSSAARVGSVRRSSIRPRSSASRRGTGAGSGSTLVTPAAPSSTSQEPLT